MAYFFFLNRVLWKCNFYSMGVSIEMLYVIVMKQLLTMRWCDQFVLWRFCDAMSHVTRECVSRCTIEIAVVMFAAKTKPEKAQADNHASCIACRLAVLKRFYQCYKQCGLRKMLRNVSPLDSVYLNHEDWLCDIFGPNNYETYYLETNNGRVSWK